MGQKHAKEWGVSRRDLLKKKRPNAPVEMPKRLDPSPIVPLGISSQHPYGDPDARVRVLAGSVGFLRDWLKQLVGPEPERLVVYVCPLYRQPRREETFSVSFD